MLPGDPDAALAEAIRTAIQQHIPGGTVDVTGSGGHYSIEVISSLFEGKNRVQSQRLVYRAIRHLMVGDAAPLHAVDRLVTTVP